MPYVVTKPRILFPSPRIFLLRCLLFSLLLFLLFFLFLLYLLPLFLHFPLFLLQSKRLQQLLPQVQLRQ